LTPHPGRLERTRLTLLGFLFLQLKVILATNKKQEYGIKKIDRLYIDYLRVPYLLIEINKFFNCIALYF